MVFDRPTALVPAVPDFVAAVEQVEDELLRIRCPERRVHAIGRMPVEPIDHREQRIGRRLLVREDEHASAGLEHRLMKEARADVGRNAGLAEFQHQRAHAPGAGLLLLQPLVQIALHAVERERHRGAALGPDLRACGRLSLSSSRVLRARSLKRRARPSFLAKLCKGSLIGQRELAAHLQRMSGLPSVRSAISSMAVMSLQLAFSIKFFAMVRKPCELRRRRQVPCAMRRGTACTSACCASLWVGLP